MGLPTVYFKGSQVEILNYEVFQYQLKVVLILANSATQMKCSIMLHFIWVYTVCNKYPFRGFRYTKG